MRAIIASLIMLSLLPAAWAQPAGSANTWVKDTRVSSQDILTPGQALRIVPKSEAQTLELVRGILVNRLQLTLGKYQSPLRLLDAQTTPRTILPEKIAGQNTLVLANQDFYFLLEIKLKTENDKTRIILAASPVYRVTPKKANPSENSIEIKVKSDSTQAVSMGPILVMPTAGQPADFNLQTLPDAAERAASLVRSFMYFLDAELAGKK